MVAVCYTDSYDEILLFDKSRATTVRTFPFCLQFLPVQIQIELFSTFRTFV